MMRPSVNTDFVSSHVFISQDFGEVNNTGANDEERSLEILFIEVLQESGGCISLSMKFTKQEQGTGLTMRTGPVIET